jgi:EmrB/QacA subfamily drug resistance transporter
MVRSRSLTVLLVVMCASLALVIGANSSLSLALPDIARDTGATQTQLTWVVNAYALVFAALLLPVGLAADRYGRRGALVLGLAVFGGASLASAFTSEPLVLIALRALAGAGAAAVMPATLSVLVDAYPPERRSRAIAVWAGVSGAGALFGVVLAGVLVESFWWGSVQVAYGVGALAAVLASLAVVPTSSNPDLPVDAAGGVLSLLALSGIVFGVVEGPERGWTDGLTVTALVVGAVSAALFVRHELRAADPMLDVRLFRSPGLAAGSALVFLQFFAAFGFFFLAPQFLQYVRDFSPLEAALALLPIALGIGPASALGPRLLDRFGARDVGAFGMGQMATSFALFAWLADGPYWQFAVTLSVFGFGFGLAVTPGTVLIIDGLPEDRRTLSAAVNDVTREVGGALGGAVLASVLVAVYADRIAGATGGLPPDAAAVAGEGAAQALGIAQQLGPGGAALAEAARDAFTDGYALALSVGAVVLLLGAVVTGLVAPRRVRADEAVLA